MYKVNKLLLVLISFLAAMIIWSLNAKVDQIIRASVEVQAQDSITKIKNRYPGTIEKININLGQQVKRGELLFSIDPEQSSEDLVKMKYKFYYISAHLSKIRSEIKGHPSVSFEPNVPHELVEVFTEMLIVDRQKKQSEEDKIKVEIEMLNTQILQSQKVIDNFSQYLKVLLDQKKLYQNLIDTGTEPKIKMIEIEKEILIYQNDIDQNLLNITYFQNEIRKKESELKILKESYLTKLQDQLAELLEQYESLRNDIIKIESIVQKSQIKSPIDGIVSDVSYNSKGEILGEIVTLAEIVPLNSIFLIEAEMPHEEIIHIKSKQPGRLMLNAYDFADHGHLDVYVKSIAQNITKSNEGEDFYRVILEIQNFKLSKSGIKAELTNGMKGNVDILGKKISIFQYFTNPILKIKQTAFTEY